MPIKIFTTIDGPCPFGKNVTIDSTGCQSCEHFYRTGTGTFFWCNHPIERKPAEIARKDPKIERKDLEIEQPKRKRGRPPGKAKKKTVKTRKKKNG